VGDKDSPDAIVVCPDCQSVIELVWHDFELREGRTLEQFILDQHRLDGLCQPVKEQP
jgi:hypothetical protein